ncbi:MAG: restriction endonuclease subunit S [Candidatus Humimicrobiia bacterium]
MSIKNLRDEMNAKQTLKDIKVLKEEPLCFILNYTLHEKISVHYYNPRVLDILKNLENSSIKLSLNSIKKEIISGPWGFQLHTTDYVPEDFPGSVWLLQIVNLGMFGNIIKTKYDKFISKEKDEELKSSRVKKGDIIIAKTGAIDRCVILEKEINANLNQALGIIRLKKEYDHTRIIPKFIHEFLNSKYGVSQLMRIGGYRMGQSGLSLAEIGSIILLLPSEKKQLKILNRVEELKHKSKNNIQEYKKIIKGIKNIISEKLKIKLPIESNKEQIFPCDLPNNPKKRIDVLFNNPYRDELINVLKKYSYKKLEEITTIEEKGEIPPSEFYRLVDLIDISEDLGEVVNIKEVPILKSTKTIFRKDEILVSKLQPNKGKIILINDETDGCVGSSELVPLRLISEDVLLEYLWIILRSDYVLKQWKYEITGSSRERIGKTELRNTIIPIPKKNIQQEIINKVKEKVKQAKKLLDEYETNKQKAKQVFLEMLFKA